ncbi:MAG TPA: diguanylate cyclase [Acidimicrobiales bacterium]|nr:diguanylate cyclase [Acidimicrobiales bacterium]
MRRLRHLLLLAASVLLICVTGALAIGLTVQASNKADAIHLQDRQSLQRTLGGLGKQYLLFSLKEGLDYASTGTWALTRGNSADTARLQTFVTHAVLLNYGAALVDLGAHELSSYSLGPGLPPVSDPGYQPMIRDLLARRPDVSSVMSVGSLHVVAMGVPVTVNGVVKAVFVGFVRLDTSPLETYVRALHYGHTGRTYVVDSTGTVVAATDPQLIGRPFGQPRAQSDIAHGRVSDYVDDSKQIVVADSTFGVSGWGGATLQSESEFFGPLNSGRLHVELGIVAVLVIAGVMVLVLNHRREVSRRRFQAQLAYQATHDGLTGLYNHSVFHERLEAALSRSQRNGLDVAVLYLDLDAFKPVNDQYGHEIGDKVLAEVAGRLRTVTRTEDVVSRMGGDEFAVLVEDVVSRPAVEALAERILEVVARPLTLPDGEAAIGASIGVADSRLGGDAESIIRDADLAMYRAKDAGRGRYEWATVGAPIGVTHPA